MSPTTYINVVQAQTPEPPAVTTELYCSCVSYVHFLEPKAPFIDAKWYKDFPKATPAVGRIAVFNYNEVYHVALITNLGTSTFKVKEANFVKCSKGERDVDYNDPRLIGFFAP